ncbi:MAG: glycine oxidase ThiO [Mariprofundaceae bacterium]
MPGGRVVIIGGGIIGCLTAWYLQRVGATPIVLDRGKMGQESSWAGAGILCPIYPWLYPDAFTHLLEASLAMYPGMRDELEAESGICMEWRRSGLMIPFLPGDHLAHKSSALNWSARFGWQADELDALQARQAESTLADDVQGALLWGDVGQVRNPRFLQAIRKALDLRRTEMREEAECAGLVEQNGCVRGVRLVGGEVIEADAVLLAAGSWSGELSKQLGFSLPVQPVKGQIVLLRDEPGRMRHIIKHDRAYFVPRADGRILVGASMENVGFKRGTSVRAIHALLDAVIDIVPGLAQAEVEHQWMGFRPGSPDGLPFLGPVPNKPGLWVAAGHYRNGVALAPVTADIMSRWVLGNTPPLDMEAFRLDRPVADNEALGYP